MTVLYRLTDIPSTNPSPIFNEDKLALNKLCLQSFVEAFKDVNPTMIFLLDYCPPSYTEMIEEVVPFKKKLKYTEIGINGTMLKAYDIAKKIDDIILFQECDYIYRPGTGEKLEKAIAFLGLVSPYDHRNFYIDKTLHSDQVTLKLVDDYHFRTTERNTMTFGVTPDIFRDHFYTFYRYGYLDGDVWYDLKKKEHELYVPIPSFATHCVESYLAPSVSWKSEWEKYL